MEYILGNGKSVIIRKPQIKDAEAIINVMSIADTETLFLARNPGEFCTSIEREREIIQNIHKDSDVDWFVAEYVRVCWWIAI